MKQLLIIAHGSRRQASNDEVHLLTRQIAARTDHGFDQVDCAFLELADPSIPDAIRSCAAQGSSDIVVLPYFLSAGRHVSEDIPREIEATRNEFPELEIKLAPYLGSIPGIADLMINHVNHSRAG
jgi:sirohydrochlorin ferrochelatase